MRCEVGLIIEWSRCDTGDIAIKSVIDVMEYVRTIVKSNAEFDRIALSVECTGVKELDDDENEEEKNGSEK